MRLKNRFLPTVPIGASAAAFTVDQAVGPAAHRERENKAPSDAKRDLSLRRALHLHKPFPKTASKIMNAAVGLPFAVQVSDIGCLFPPAPPQEPELPVSAIRDQLTKILQSPGFVRAHRMRHFLSFLVEETLAGRSNHLCEYTIALEVYGKDESFEPCLDPIVRNEARRLRLKLLEFSESAPKTRGDQIIIDVPKRSYVPTFRRDSRRPEMRHEYRLTISLTRIADNVEVWSTQHEY